MPVIIQTYAYMPVNGTEPLMPRAAPLTRRSFFVDAASLRKARRVLHVRSDAEAVRVSLERVAEMDVFWRFMTKSRRALEPGTIDVP